MNGRAVSQWRSAEMGWVGHVGALHFHSLLQPPKITSLSTSKKLQLLQPSLSRRSTICPLSSRRFSIQATAKKGLSTSALPIVARKENNGNLVTERYAVVTGANKGIGLETAKQLASQGIRVILTARNEQRGLEVVSKLHELGLPNVVFHQLDVLDPVSIDSLAKFIADKFGRLDILVNNAGASGVVVDEEGLRALNIDPSSWLSGKATNLVQSVIKTNNEKAEECLNTNYYGLKGVTESLLPLLQKSLGGARIVNVSSLRSELKRIPGEHIRKELGDVANLSEKKIDALLKRFLHDLKEDRLEENGWTMMLPSYSISKASVNAYTRILARKHPKMYINCVHPGYVDTDINWHTGTMTVEEGARGSLKLALLPDGGPTGCYFDQTELAEF
ncbi:(+)-neomenthol dehydrogenase-like [Momordica charantia]|uniref:(+)-neomenthol dehydrogenase-like n=1 Tax=Momordica charantia TaxID=3673 RepID=A0A6J1DT42_MOMCH|nr:(+)-neomenthol dehydrogenase-like [Momordica charantia]